MSAWLMMWPLPASDMWRNAAWFDVRAVRTQRLEHRFPVFVGDVERRNRGPGRLREVGEHVDAAHLGDGAVDALRGVAVRLDVHGGNRGTRGFERRDRRGAEWPIGIDDGDAFPVERPHVAVPPS